MSFVFALIASFAISFSPVANAAMGDYACILQFDNRSEVSLLIRGAGYNSAIHLTPNQEAREAQRMVNRDIWENAPNTPWLAHGPRTLQSWLNGLHRVIALANQGQAPTVALFKELHFLVSEGMAFHGFEGRRVRAQFDRGEISRERMRELLNQAYLENMQVAGVDHNTLRGAFRSDLVDDVLHAGSSIDPETGTRYFDQTELDAIRRNPHMRVEESTVVEFEPGKFRGQTFYTHPSLVAVSVGQAFGRLRLALADAKSSYDVIHAAATLQIELMSIHPFLDGNGRTIRLMTDLILLSHGLPPPLRAVEVELEATADELAILLIHEMREYNNSRGRTP